MTTTTPPPSSAPPFPPFERAAIRNDIADARAHLTTASALMAPGTAAGDAQARERVTEALTAAARAAVAFLSTADVPVRTVVADRSRDPWRKTGPDAWLLDDDGEPLYRTHADLLADYGPLTITHLPVSVAP